MALTTIAGTILVPMGVAPSNARLVFTLATWDMDNNIVWAPDPTIEPLSGSAYSIALESTTDKERQAAYKVELRWYSTLERTTMNEVLGIIAVPATGGPYDLPDLLSVPFVEPVPAEILALCLAAQSAASSAATSAVASAVAAALYAPAYYDDVSELLASTDIWPVSTKINTRKEGSFFVVAPSLSTDHDLVNAAGTKFYCFDNDVRSFGAAGDGVTDDAAAVIAASETGFVHFPRVDGGETTYKMQAYDLGDFDGATWSAENGVTVDTFYDLFGQITGDVTFDTDVRLSLSQKKNKYIVPPTPKDWRKECLPMPQTASEHRQVPVVLASEVAPLQIDWPTGDTFAATTGSVNGSRYVVTAAGGGAFWRGAFVDLGPWETVSGFIENAADLNNGVGVLIRGTGGFAIVYGNGQADVMVMSKKLIGAAVVSTAVDWSRLGMGRYASFAPKKAVWGVSRTTASRAVVLLNGQALCDVDGIGDIFDVGFVSYENNSQFAVMGLCRQRRTSMKLGQPQLDVLQVFGDSTASAESGSWSGYMRQLLDGLAGVRLGSVVNQAVPGITSAQTLAIMNAAAPFTGSPYVVICAGTNDIGGQTNLAAFEVTVQAILDLVALHGRRAVWVLPWMFYTQSQSLAATGQTGQGQASVNYDAGAKYRSAIQRLVMQAGGVLVDTTAALPNPDPSYLLSDPDSPLLRDNIHQDQKAYQLYALAVAQAIANDYLAMPDSVESQLHSSGFKNGSSGVEFRVIAEKGGVISLSGTINITSVASQVIATLPRWARPSRNINMGVTTYGSVIGAGRLFIQPNGNITQADIPAGATLLFVNATYRLAL